MPSFLNELRGTAYLKPYIQANPEDQRAEAPSFAGWCLFELTTPSEKMYGRIIDPSRWVTIQSSPTGLRTGSC